MKKMTPEDVRARIDEIRASSQDEEAVQSLTHRLYRDVLEQIACNNTGARKLAAAALEPTDKTPTKRDADADLGDMIRSEEKDGRKNA